MEDFKVGWIVLGEEQQDPYVSPWGLMKSSKDLHDEHKRIEEDIEELEDQGFDLEGGDIIRRPSEVDDLQGKYNQMDALLVFGVSGSGRDIGKALAAYDIPLIWFVKVTDEKMYGHALYQQWYDKDFSKDEERIDLVVNNYDTLVSKLKALGAIKKLGGSKILCIGEPNDFFGGGSAARKAVKKFDVTIEGLYFEEFKEELEQVDLHAPEVREIKNNFLENAKDVSDEIKEERALRSARIYKVLKDLMEESDCDAVSVNCLSGILNLIETTPCLAFKKLRDEGIPAVCEADIPQTITSILLRNISDKPTFINDPVIVPDENKMILAHCTSPTKMRGYDEEAEPYDAELHHETKLGVAPSVKFEEGQEVTVAGFSHDFEEMIAVEGKIKRNTDYHICITQVEVEVQDASYLLENFVGFHWVLVYGSYLEELENLSNYKEFDFLTPQ